VQVPRKFTCSGSKARAPPKEFIYHRRLVICAAAEEIEEDSFLLGTKKRGRLLFSPARRCLFLLLTPQEANFNTLSSSASTS